MLYHIALVLRLAVQSNITVVIKDAGDIKSSFISYIPNIPVRIKDIIVKQPFFILEKESNSCILGRSFETVTHMARQMLNDESVCVTIFDSEDDIVQTIFQSYTPEDTGNCFNYKIVETYNIQATTLKAECRAYAGK